MSINHIVQMLTTACDTKKEPRAKELALYTSAKKKEKNDGLEGGVRKRAETEGRECWKKRKNRKMWGTITKKTCPKKII